MMPSPRCWRLVLPLLAALALGARAQIAQEPRLARLFEPYLQQPAKLEEIFALLLDDDLERADAGLRDGYDIRLGQDELIEAMAAARGLAQRAGGSTESPSVPPERPVAPSLILPAEPAVDAPDWNALFDGGARHPAAASAPVAVPSVPKQGRRRWVKTALKAGAVGTGAYVLARHNREHGDMSAILAIDVLGSAAATSLMGKKNRPLDERLLSGAMGGLLMFTGKEIMAHTIDQSWGGLPGKLVHAGGVSMRDNTIRGREALENYEIDLGPMLLGLRLKDGLKPYLHLLPAPAAAAGWALAHGRRLDLASSAKAGTFVFRRSLDAYDALGMAQYNIILIDESRYSMAQPDFNRVLLHEAIHTLNYSELGFLGISINDDAFKDLKPAWLRIERDIFWGFFGLSGLLSGFQVHEREPEAWERKYFRSRRPLWVPAAPSPAPDLAPDAGPVANSDLDGNGRGSGSLR